MQRDPEVTGLLLRNIHSWLVIGGLVLLLLAQVTQATILHLQLSDVLANLGALLLITGSIQWLFDAYLRKELFHEVARTTLKNVNVSRSGISDVMANGKSVDFTDLIKHSDHLILGRNWSTRVLKQYIEAFRHRAANGKPTTFIVLDPEADAAKFVQSTLGTPGQMVQNAAEFEHIVAELRGIAKVPDKIRLLKSDRILHYSFTGTEDSLWLTTYKNSRGLADMPAIELTKNTLLYDHFWRDIEALIAHCEKR